MIAVLPLVKLNHIFPITALLIGTVIPDFVMFFPLSSYEYSHSIIGLFFYSIPMGYLFYGNVTNSL